MQDAPNRDRRRMESPVVMVIRLLLYALATVLYLRTVASPAGIVAAIVWGGIGVGVAQLAARLRIRLAAAVLFAVVTLGLAPWLGSLVLRFDGVVRVLGLERALIVGDMWTFGLGAFALLALLRLLAIRFRTCALLEVALVVGSVIMALADHRHRMIHRPRFLSDWAWSRGIDPTTVLVASGIAVMFLSVFLLLQRQRLLKLISSVLLLLLLGLSFFAVGEKRIAPPEATDALGLSRKQGKQPHDGQGKAGGHGKDESPFKDNYEPPTPPQPVAVLILRDDFTARDEVMYLRQRVLSRFNGVNLTADATLDDDVPTDFPKQRPIELHSYQHSEAHLRLPTTMFLLVDHPQPLALTHALRLAALDNPNPRQFVTTYEVESQTLAVPAERLLGHRSVPSDWPLARKKHYTALPDDPRYAALADAIVQHIDPRFVDDDVAKAYAIKRYLEHEGFYTRRTTYADQHDPTAAFVFGSLRGYCVHFAHAAVYLFRSQGIAARVALGYAVQTLKRSGGSTVLVMSDRAHAWPEIFLEGIGWVSFDIYPERTDMPPPVPVDYDLERTLGELARRDPTGGIEPVRPMFTIPWQRLKQGAIWLISGCLVVLYLLKLGRRWLWRWLPTRMQSRWAYRAVLDALAEQGLQRKLGETREQHAQRLVGQVPRFGDLTWLHLAATWGRHKQGNQREFVALAGQVHQQLKQQVRPLRRWLAWIDPLSWVKTR